MARPASLRACLRPCTCKTVEQLHAAGGRGGLGTAGGAGRAECLDDWASQSWRHPQGQLRPLPRALLLLVLACAQAQQLVLLLLVLLLLVLLLLLLLQACLSPEHTQTAAS
jgi:hypothetical protein